MFKKRDLVGGLLSLMRGESERGGALERAIGHDTYEELQRLVAKERGVPPKVAVIGKAGVGKTTTINNVFNANWKTSHSVAGTKAAQRKEFELAGGGSLTVLDMPGLGEDIDSDEIYEEIYRQELPKVDVILYVLQANERILGEDQRILNNVVLKALDETLLNSRKQLQDRIIIGLNKVDLIGPGQWDNKLNYPSPEQEVSIERRCDDIITKLSRVVPIKMKNMVYYSAEKRYRLYDLLIAIIRAAGSLGWKFPVQPKDPFELADSEVQEFVKQVKAQKRR